MPRKPTNKKNRQKWNVNDWRGYNYMTQFDKRAFVHALPENILANYQRAASMIPCPKLNLYGVGEYTREQEHLIFAVNQKFGLDVWYLNPWYCTESGWEDFQKQWTELPELIHVPCIPIADLIEKEKVDKVQNYPHIHRQRPKEKVVPR